MFDEPVVHRSVGDRRSGNKSGGIAPEERRVHYARAGCAAAHVSLFLCKYVRRAREREGEERQRDERRGERGGKGGGDIPIS